MNNFGDDLIEAMGQALAHARGKAVEGIIIHRVDLGELDIRRIRTNLKLTQEEMAVIMGTSPSGYRKWEQGQRQPTGAARVLLKVMECEPEAVIRSLQAGKAA